jgi:hypothetical protein
MTTTQDLIDLVELLPTCDTYAGMLYDHLQEDRDMTHQEALTHVEHVRAPALRAWQIAQAAAHLATGSKYRGRLRGRILAHVGAATFWRYTILIVEGNRTPYATVNPDGRPDEVWSDVVVTVGALWVTAEVETIRTEWEKRRDRKKPPAPCRRPPRSA